MPNIASHAGHKPQRTCQICKKKVDRSSMLKFLILERQVVFDMKHCLPGHGYYICEQNTCWEQLETWLKKRKKKNPLREILIPDCITDTV